MPPPLYPPPHPTLTHALPALHLPVSRWFSLNSTIATHHDPPRILSPGDAHLCGQEANALERMHFLASKLLPAAAGTTGREVRSAAEGPSPCTPPLCPPLNLEAQHATAHCVASPPHTHFFQVAFTFSSGFLLDAVRFRMQSVHRDTLTKFIQLWNEKHQSEVKKIYLKKMLDDSVRRPFHGSSAVTTPVSLPLSWALSHLGRVGLRSLQMTAGTGGISKSAWMFARKNQKSGWRGGSMFGSEWKRRWVTLTGRELHMFKEDTPVEVGVAP